MAKLLPCRCCKGRPGYYDSPPDDAAGVICESCGFDLPPVVGDGRAQARARWNEFMAADLGALSKSFCEMAERRGEVVPPGLAAELTLYASEMEIVALVAEIGGMVDLQSYLSPRIAVPSMHSLH
jgi:hypothetical protein